MIRRIVGSIGVCAVLGGGSLFMTSEVGAASSLADGNECLQMSEQTLDRLLIDQTLGAPTSLFLIDELRWYAQPSIVVSCAHPRNGLYRNVIADRDGDGYPDPVSLCEGNYMLGGDHVLCDRAQVRANLVNGVPSVRARFITDGNEEIPFGSLLAGVYEESDLTSPRGNLPSATLIGAIVALNGEPGPEVAVTGYEVESSPYGTSHGAVTGYDEVCGDGVVDNGFSQFELMYPPGMYPELPAGCVPIPRIPVRVG